MRKQILSALIVSTITLSATAADAQYRKRYPPGYWQEHQRDLDNRRDARRAGLATAIVVSGVTKAAQENRIEQRYRDCLRDSYYDVDCDRRRYYEENQARKTARRRAIVTGAIVRDAVRD